MEQKIIHHFINGQTKQLSTDRFGFVYNPSLGIVEKKVAFANTSDVNQVITIAQQAFQSWSLVPPAKRAQIIFKYRELLIKNIDAIAELVSTEHGKTLDDAKGSIGRGLEVVEYCCGIANLLKSDYTANVAASIDSYNLRQPLGVCAGITPFNFPAMVPLWMFPVAIACGNTFILKPSEKDPSTAMYLAELMSKAGLPDGVLNVVNGDRVVVDTLLESKNVQAISFVGSTPVGEYIYQKGCSHNKRVQALCGAKNHMVIMPDADISVASHALLGAAYGSAGERCMAISVAVCIGDQTADQLVSTMIPKVKNLKIGAYNQTNIDMGPIITMESKTRIENAIQSGIDENAELVVDGRGLQVDGYENGFFLGGSLFDRVTKEMKIYKEEIFGPVLCIVRVDSYDEALNLVTENRYGNGASIFTQNGNIARNFAHDVKIGMVGINVPIPVPVAYHSFGGWKASLFGDHAIHGMEGIHFYTQLKTITAGWKLHSNIKAQFHFKSGSDQS